MALGFGQGNYDQNAKEIGRVKGLVRLAFAKGQ